MKIQIVDRPLIRHKHTLMRVRETSTSSFPKLVNQVATLPGYEVTRDPGADTRTINTLLEELDAAVIKGKKLCFMSICFKGYLHDKNSREI